MTDSPRKDVLYAGVPASSPPEACGGEGARAAGGKLANTPVGESTNAATDCPSVVRLAAVLQGTLAEPEELILTGHLERCEACRRRLERLAAGERFHEDVARCLPGADRPPAPLAAVMEQFVEPPVSLETRLSQEESTAGMRAAISWPAEFPRAGVRLDRYQLLREIGRGGMGVVFAARDVTLDRLVAIKVLAPQWTEDKVARQRFSAEARAAAAVNSRYVVTIHAVEDRGEWPYLVMEHLAGSNLQQLLDTRGPLPVSAITHIGTRIALGLAAAHERGLVHRDIKPANVLVVPGSGQVKLTDFGLARAGSDSRLTEAGMVVGTLAYMAPEQLEGLSIDFRVDLYGLGCVLYAMCCGRPPIDGANSLAIMRGVLWGRIPSLASLRPQLPTALIALVEQLLARDPTQRVASAAEAARRLKLVRGDTGAKNKATDPETANQWPPGTAPRADSPATVMIREAAEPAVDPMAPFVAGAVRGPESEAAAPPTAPPLDAWPADFAAAEFFGARLPISDPLSPTSPPPSPLSSPPTSLPLGYLPPECVATDRIPPAPVAADRGVPPSATTTFNAALRAAADSAGESAASSAGDAFIVSAIPSSSRQAASVRRPSRRADLRLQTYLLAGCAGLTLLLIVVVLVATREHGGSTAPTPSKTPSLAATTTPPRFASSSVPNVVESPRPPVFAGGVPPEPRPGNMEPRPGNFVEVQKPGTAPRQFSDLRSAIEFAPNGAELLLRGGEIWRTGPLEIRGKQLRIRGASPREGRILFVRDEWFSGPLLRTDSPLVLEGLTLIDPDARSAPNGKGPRAPAEDGVVVVVGGRLVLDRCRIGTARVGACVWVDWAEQVEVRNCQLAAPVGVGIAYRDSQGPGEFRPRNLRVEDSTSLARVGLFLDVRPDPRGGIILSHCLFLGESALHVEMPRVFETPSAGPHMRIECRQVVFDCDALMTGWTRVGEGPLERVRAIEALPRRIAWQGESNVIQPAAKFLLLRPLQRFPAMAGGGPPAMAAPIVTDLDGWRRFWPSAEGNTVLREPRYGTAAVTRANLPENRSQPTFERAPGEDFERWVERLERSAGLHLPAEISLR